MQGGARGGGSSHFLSPGKRLQGKTSEQGGEASGLQPDVRMGSLVPRQITQMLMCDRAVTLHPGILWKHLHAWAPRSLPTLWPHFPDEKVVAHGG